MTFPYIDTPRTELDGNATHLSNGPRSTTRHNLSALSIENSFQAPDKDRNLLQEFENVRTQKTRGLSSRTPRVGQSSRSSQGNRQSLSGAATSKGEFTPLLKSVTKSNLLRTADRRARTRETPSYRRTSGLSNIDEMDVDEDSSMDEDNDATPVPQVASSSVQSTPLPVLPRRGNNEVVGDGQNMMTLREQENMINKLDKENFGLKLKIHYLEQALEKRGPEFNRAALAENTELKIAKVTMQRDLQRYKKSLLHAERDLEACQLQLQELRQNSRAKGADDTIQRELEWMCDELESKDLEINALREDIKAAKSLQSDEIEKLREEVESLEFTVREKDRLLDDRDEEIEDLKQKESEANNSLAELERELKRAKAQLEDIQQSLEQARSEAKDAKEASEKALAEKDRAVENLRELQDEMANKSFHTKGLSRQLEEKANNLEEELSELRQRHATLQDKLADSAEQERRLRERIEDLQEEFASEKEAMQSEIEIACRERDIAKRDHENILTQLRETEDELRSKGDAKNLLQTRHDALTEESRGLQRDLERARETIAELEQRITVERGESQGSFHELQARHRAEVKQLNDEIASLRRAISDKEAQFSADRDEWERSKRTLESQRNQAEQQAAGYKRTVDRLQSMESALSGKEVKLQQMLESEKQRHSQEEELLNRQIKELNEEISSRRTASEAQRLELLSVKEELRVSRREVEDLKEKAQNLEDEVVVLQASLDEQQEYAKGQRKSGNSDAEKQLQNVNREKQALCEQLARANAELNELRSSISDLEAERDELQSQLHQFETQVDNAHRLDQEKLSLRKTKLRLESEIQRLKEEKKALAEDKDLLQRDLDAEIERAMAEENRLSSEISKLQNKLALSSEKRDRHLLSARMTVERLEARTKELESLIEREVPLDAEKLNASPDLSILRHSLELARKKEKVQLQRESELKASIKELKSYVTDLEKENYELRTERIDSVSPRASISSKLEAEIRSLREQLLDAHKTMKSLRVKNHELQRNIVDDKERKDLHELLKSSALEAESLSLKLSERDARVNQLRAHLRRVREERTLSVKKADAAIRELEALRDRYESLLDDLTNHPERSGRHEKEIRGLSKEIMWLRARLRREEKFRKDLAWSKGLMELAERVRIACNETDLRMIAEMGVEASVHEPRLGPRRKLRAVAFVAIATARMRKMAAEWGKAKMLGDSLHKAKNEVLRRRESSKRLYQLNR
ncbi:hypothetical protein VTO42DRAFT_942 [Malbranchea cinnamomea]